MRSSALERSYCVVGGGSVVVPAFRSLWGGRLLFTGIPNGALCDAKLARYLGVGMA